MESVSYNRIAKYKKNEERLSWTLNREMVVNHKVKICIPENWLALKNSNLKNIKLSKQTIYLMNTSKINSLHPFCYFVRHSYYQQLHQIPVENGWRVNDKNERWTSQDSLPTSLQKFFLSLNWLLVTHFISSDGRSW
jgi:hypothetical protein